MLAIQQLETPTIQKYFRNENQEFLLAYRSNNNKMMFFSSFIGSWTESYLEKLLLALAYQQHKHTLRLLQLLRKCSANVKLFKKDKKQWSLMWQE